MGDHMRMAVAFVLLLLAAWSIDSFHHFLEFHHDRENPVTEFNVIERKPLSMETMLIQQCPNELNKAQVFIDCYKAIKNKMRRSDI